MKTKNIFIGTIKKCTNLYCYERYGEEHYFVDFKVGNIGIGSMRKFVNIIAENAVLVKVNENEYIWLDMIKNKTDEFLVNLGIPVKTIKTTPHRDNSLFVDEETLKPLKNKSDNLSVKKVKTLVLKK